MGFKAWLNKGVVKLQDVYKDYTLMSFNELKAKYDIPQKHFFKYLQLRSFILANLNNSILETHVTKNCFGKRLISRFNNMIAENHKENFDSKRQKWI